MDKVTIEIDSRWVKIVHSPLYWIVAALQGVSITFAPLFLYWSGKGMFHHGSEGLIVPSCFVRIPGQGERDSGGNVKNVPGRW